MAELQARIAEMANRVSSQIFRQFGWERRPHKDADWPCCTKAHKKKTHPSDVVFYYESPFPKDSGRVYLNTDLKSYAKATITKEAVENALISLAMATECANKSPDWQKLYQDTQLNSKVYGMLFIYNHDQEYDKDFKSLLLSITSSLIKVKAGFRLFIFGPEEIRYLLSIATDMAILRQESRLPDLEYCRFYLPDLVKLRVTHKELQSASAEMLKMPWQIIKYSPQEDKVDQPGYIVYYRGECSSSDELKFLLDYFFRFQLVGDKSTILIRAPFAVNEATSYFETAKEQYCQKYFGYKDIDSRLKKITLEKVICQQANFSTTELGMDPR